MSVAITGWAWRTGLGSSVDEVISQILEGKHAIGPHRDLTPHTYACPISVQIKEKPKRSRHRRFARRMELFGMEVAHEALAMSGVQGGERLGAFAGVGGLRAHWDEMMPALQNQQDDHQDMWERGFKLFHPFWMLKHLSNNAHALFAADVKAQGEGLTFGGANAGACALHAAICALKTKAIDAAVVFAYDSLVHPDVLVELAARKRAVRIPQQANVGDDQTWKGPYDKNSDGLIPGEAAAALVLERVESTSERTLAWLSCVDGADGMKYEPEPRHLSTLLSRLLSEDEAAADSSRCVVDGASIGCPLWDLAEREILSKHLGVESPLISLTSSLGHVGAAQSLVQSIALTKFLAHGLLPPIIGLEQPSDGALRPLTAPEATLAKRALGISAFAPGLMGMIQVHLPE